MSEQSKFFANFTFYVIFLKYARFDSRRKAFYQGSKGFDTPEGRFLNEG
jgi:hypothetical protein